MLPIIFLTNDDGIQSPGLLAAAQALFSIGKLVIVAPSCQQTSMGRSYAGALDAHLEPYMYNVDGNPVEAYACDASPAAVVRHALMTLPDLRPSLLVAGINYGENIGFSVTGSGTVGAALEAAAQGVPALAVSLETDIRSQREYTNQNWSGSIYFTRYFAEFILSRKTLPPGVDVMKVEIPAKASPTTPWRITRLSPFSYYEAHLDNPTPETPRSATYFTKRDGQGEPLDTDAYAIRTAKEVTVTPLTLDMTAFSALGTTGEWFGKSTE